MDFEYLLIIAIVFRFFGLFRTKCAFLGFECFVRYFGQFGNIVGIAPSFSLGILFKAYNKLKY